MTARVVIAGDSEDAQRAMNDLRATVDRLGAELESLSREARQANDAIDDLGGPLANRRLANFANLTTGVAAGLGLLRGAFQAVRDSMEGYFRAQEGGQELFDQLETSAREVYGALFELIVGTDDATVAFDRVQQAISVTVRAVDLALNAFEPFAALIRGPVLLAMEAFSEGTEESRRELAAMQAQLSNAEAAARGYEEALRSLGGDTIQVAQGALDALTGAGSDFDSGLHIQMDTIRSMIRVLDEQGRASLLVRDRTLDGLSAQADAFAEFQSNARRALDPFITQLVETGDSIDTLRGQTLRFTQEITGTDGLTRQVEFAVPVLDLLNQTMINGQPASAQLATNLDLLNAGYRESAAAAEQSASGNATAAGAFVEAGRSIEEEYNPAIRRALELLQQLEPHRAKAIAQMQAEKDAMIEGALAKRLADEEQKRVAELRREQEEQRAEQERRAELQATADQQRANEALAQSYAEVGRAVAEGTDSITQATIRAATDQLRALILRYIGEAAALGAVGRVGASVALGAAIGVMQRSLNQLGGTGSAAASGASALPVTRTVQNISVSVAQTNGLGAGVDSTRAIGAAVEDGIRRGLINLEGRR